MRIYILGLALLTVQFVFSQQPRFVAKKSGNDLYIEHKVQPKENWYSVGRIYFISPKDIAKYNSTTIEKGLSIGQTLRIPLNAGNFTQSSSSKQDDVPVLHIVQPKETLFKVASGYGASVADIKRWNQLRNEQLNAGSSLVIGFLRASVALPAEQTVAAVAASPAQTADKPAVVPTQPAEKPAVVAVQTATKPVAVPAQASVKPAPLPPVKETPPAPRPQEQKPVAGTTGQFSALYDQQSKEGKQQILENPVYGVFKSTSGWQDGKYYVLLNNVVPGTIVKINCKTTGKQLYAKVLGAVPAGKESEGMAMRMSNASQAALGIAEGALVNVELSWFN